MEARKKQKKAIRAASTGKTPVTELTLTSKYIAYVLTHGRQPLSVYSFCAELGISELEFYKYFNSFEVLEKAVWKGLMDQSIATIRSDENFENFSTREKVLTFYYTHVQLLTANRSFILYQLQKRPRLDVVPTFLKSYKKTFEEFISELLTSGKAKGEVAERPYLDKVYPSFFWAHLSFLILFWKNDDSPAFEKTDAFIEKSVNFAFELVGKGALDAAFDFGKFLYQSQVK